MKIPNSEFDFTFSRSSGAGGQNVNKLNTKATLSWDIDESTAIGPAVKKRFKEKFSRFITVEGKVKIVGQRFRTQTLNIQDCIDKLHEMLEQVAKAPRKRIATKPTKSSQKKRVDSKKKDAQTKKNRQKVKF